MTRNLLFATIGLAIVNGVFSPLVIAVFLFYPLWYPSWAPALTEIVVALSSILLATLTLMVAGVPAALWERFRGPRSTDSTSAAIWLGGAVLLTLPAFPNILRALGIA